MFTLCVLIAAARLQDPPMEDLVAFKHAFESRKSDWVGYDIDPGISKALNILIQNQRRGNDCDMFSWIIRSEDEEPTVTDIEYVFTSEQNLGSERWLTAGICQVTRLEVFDQKGKLSLPKEFDWNYLWNPSVVRLPSGMVFVEENAMSHGTVTGYRAVWLRRLGRTYTKVGAVETKASIEQLPAEVKDNTVILKTIDDFKSFQSYSASHAGGKVTVWDCSGKKPAMKKSWHVHPEVWFADRTIAFALKHPKLNAINRLIAKTWKSAEAEFWGAHMLDDWSVNRAKDGTIKLNLNDELLFGLKKTKTGYQLLSVKEITNKKVH